jgi:glycosyltransferase involved in cell wall biosynthesis
VCSLGFVDLRQLYADAQFVVMPLHETDFQAGVTTILEAMAMGKAVVCTRTNGQTDVVIDGITGMYVPPGDAVGLRAAIERLRRDPTQARRLGDAARSYIEQECDVRVYARRLSEVVTRSVARSSSLPTQQASTP